MNYTGQSYDSPDYVTTCCMGEKGSSPCKNPLAVIFTVSSGTTPYYGYCQSHWDEKLSQKYHVIKFVNKKSISHDPLLINHCCSGDSDKGDCQPGTCQNPCYMVFKISPSSGYWGYCKSHWGSGAGWIPVKNLETGEVFQIEVKSESKSEPKSQSKTEATIVTPSEFRTQKAIGLKALRDSDFQTPAFDIYGVEAFGFESPFDREYYDQEVSQMHSRLKTLKTLKDETKGGEKSYLSGAITQLETEIQTKKDRVIAKQLGMFQIRAGLSKMVNKFVRPCPMVPRHGFVDSRPVNNLDEAEKLLEETIKAEDNAEFIIMPFIKAEYSGIWTNGKLVIGRGNDGATAGHTSKSIPALGIPCTDEYTWKKTLERGRVTETPYVELLWAKKYDYESDLMNYFVQLRNGPSLPDTIDYIPEEMTVKKIVLAEGDLLEWETKAKNFTKGTVIYHPEGSLASHYAVHAVLNHLPVMISRKPELNEVLKPNTEIYTPNIEEIRNGFYLGATDEMTYEDAANAMLVGCHSTSVWLGRQDTLLGFAMGCAYRLTITAVLGEFRHEPGRKRKPKRESVYSGVWHKILSSATRTRFMKALDSFQNNPDWPGSFGGKKWYIFGSYAANIFNSILDGDVTASLENLNKCVNAVHNSGWGFDKFVHKSTLNIAAGSPSVILLRVAPKLYDTLISEKRDGGEWFKGKHHVEVEKLAEEEAERDERREEEKGTEENSFYKEKSEVSKNKESREYIKKNGYAICECHGIYGGCSKELSGVIYKFKKGLDKEHPPCMPCKAHENNFYGYQKFTPEETAAWIKRHKVIKPGLVTTAAVRMDSQDRLWLKYTVKNQTEMGQEYQLIPVDLHEKYVSQVRTLLSFCQDKKEGNYIPLTLIGGHGYLHVGEDNPFHSWADYGGKGYLNIEVKDGKIHHVGYTGLKGSL